ncbi:DUF72 domain-containing protein [Niveispirillum irakense]|uniref:DUF72 domain-containing protein n=1 Tax=Niveispirillum irakense TaxID=34011 RepID=UPI00041E5D49|nr:DUF72 domain-containing protein [Niveispirillum irakense]
MMANRKGQVRIGISGWTYAPWRGHFYPKGLVQKKELAHASRIFRSIEINGTFYGLQKPDSFARWAAEVPEDFVFAVKAPRFITHVKRLRDPLVPIANFLASGLLRLGPQLGPVLWQFPPSFRYDAELMGDFLAMLPHKPADASALAAKHDQHLKARAWLRPADNMPPLRHAVEIRHESFRNPAFIDQLRRHKVALVCADTVEWPRLMDVTADFIYCRLHGSEELYRSGYDDAALKRWAGRVQAWASGQEMRDGEFAGDPADSNARPRDVFIYFDNTDKRRAPEDAKKLEELLF